MKLNFFDKFVFFILCAFLLVRAPFFFIPLLIVIYAFYAVARTINQKIQKQKRKALKKKMKRMEKERITQEVVKPEEATTQ